MKKFVSITDLIIFIANGILFAYAVYILILNIALFPLLSFGDYYEHWRFWEGLYCHIAAVAIWVFAIWYIVRGPLIFIYRIEPRPRAWYAMILFFLHLPLTFIIQFGYFIAGV